MASTLETLFGSTNGTTTTGTFALTSELVEGGQTSLSITIPKGIRAKIWLVKVNGQPCTVNVFFNENPTGATFSGVVMPTNVNVQVDATNLSSSGTIELDNRRPIIIDSRNFATSAVSISFTWTQSAAAVSSVVLQIEWTTIEAD
jgi:hypothetical protein